MKYKAGDKILIEIGGMEVLTTIDEHGIQRLPKNGFLINMIDRGILDLNKIVLMYNNGQIPFSQLLDFYLNIGYSVCGFSDLSIFADLEIINPVWEE